MLNSSQKLLNSCSPYAVSMTFKFQIDINVHREVAEDSIKEKRLIGVYTIVRSDLERNIV